MLTLTLHGAQLLNAHKDRPYFAVLSVGSQTLTSRRHRAASSEDVALSWDASAHFILQKGGPTQARVAIYRAGKYKGALNNYLECWCSFDLADYFPAENDGREANSAEQQAESVDPLGSVGTASQDEWLDLLCNGSDGLPMHAGRLKISACASTPRQLESQLWTRLLPLADFDGDGQLCLPEFELLMQAFGAEVSLDEVRALWDRVCSPSSDGEDHHEVDYASTTHVPIPRLAEAMARAHSRGQLSVFMRRCPVDGALLTPGEDLANLLYISLALDKDVASAPTAVLKVELKNVFVAAYI